VTAEVTQARPVPILADRDPLSTSRLSLLVDLGSLLAREVDFDQLLGTACERLAHALRADRATIWLVDAERGDLVTRVALLPELPTLRQPLERGLAGYVARTGEVVRVEDASRDERFDPSADRATGYSTHSMLVAPIREDARAPVRGVVQLLNREAGPFDEEDEKYLIALATQLAAQTDATVLFRGETGTGKGLFARAVHVNSHRQARPFVTVDCTTLPAQLVESELFGHERGAFTSADRRVPGKVELAEGGTLFLDELGDLPPDIQGKLLRFLQDKTFERVGGRQTLAADVRVVSATHRDLEQAVAEGRFREDLYYRVRVVEIDLPPLRARGPDDIETLARHFAEVYAQRYQRPAPRFAPEALAALRAHAWPGNVRELEHWIESAIVLAPDGRVTGSPWRRHDTGQFPALKRVEAVTMGETPKPPAQPAPSAEPQVKLPLGLSMDDASARYAEATMEACEGNKTEAAKKLGIGRNTLARLLRR
jgi:Nif-specific regulatory protein